MVRPRSGAIAPRDGTARYLPTMRTLLLPFLIVAAALNAQVVITQTTQWTVPAGVDTATFELIGAGGSGGTNGGGGGGGGGYARRTTAVTPGTTYSIVVGAGGSGTGTIVGGLGMFAEAGGNGSSVPNPNLGGGGAGGNGVGGQVNRTGGTGGGGYWTYFGGGGGGAAGPTSNGGIGGNTIVWNGNNCLTPGGAGGTSGGGPSGTGGKGAGFTDNNCTVTDPEGNGDNYGAGGGGGNGIGSPGGTGSGGVCIISWNSSSAVAESGALESVSAVFIDGQLLVRNAPAGAVCTLVDARGAVIWSGAANAFASDAAPGVYALSVKAGKEEKVVRVVW